MTNSTPVSYSPDEPVEDISHLLQRALLERKRSEDALRASEMRFRTSLETLLDGFFILVAMRDEENLIVDFRYEYINEAGCRLNRKSRKEILNHTLMEIWLLERESNLFKQFVEVVESGHPLITEFSEPQKNGSFARIFDLRAVKLDDGLAITWQDVTDQKHAEEAIYESRQMLQLVLDHIPQRVFWKDRNLNFLGCNRLFALDAGLEQPAQIVGKNDFDLFWKEDAENYQADDRYVINNNQSKIGYEETQNRAGQQTWIMTSKVPLHDRQGNVMGILGTYEDITERKIAEKELMRQASELARSHAELEQFAYVASHDLQEPLRMVILYVQLLERRYRNQLDEEANVFIDYAVEGAQRIQKLISDLLGYLNMGWRERTTSATTDCQIALEKALARLQLVIEQSNAHITHDQLPLIKANEVQVIQLFHNLLDNAIKFCIVRRPEIHIGVERKDQQWLFAIKDNGIGIEAQYYERIFVIFQRLHSRAEYSGTGIGLAVCKNIIERYGGKIWVESQPGESSTFYFTFPD